MSTLIENIVNEKNELEAKIKKLEAFLKSEEYKVIDYFHKSLLNEQHRIMHAYRSILFKRLTHLNK